MEPDDLACVTQITLERELGVTYKTAWRMFNKIRNDLMGDDGRAAVGRRGG